MIQKYQLYVLAVLMFVSVGMNLSYAYQLRQLQMPTEPEQVYGYQKMFLDGALLYKPNGYAGFKLLDLSEATVVITESTACASITIHTPGGNIEGPCVAGYPASAFAALQKE
jgi:hypothetical protein